MTDEEKKSNGIGVIVLLVMLLPYAMYSAYVAFCLYGWFVQPITSYPIGYWHMMGLVTTIGFLRTHRTDDKTNIWFVVISVPILCTFILLVGWFAHHMMP